MTHIVGEYPYYRADPGHWLTDLTRIREEGVTSVSFYIPWRLHEYHDDEGNLHHDFTGEQSKHTNLTTFLGHIAELGLRVVIKPGPFIHAEIRYGGLPDRIVWHTAPTPSTTTLATGFETGTPIAADDPIFVREAVIWLRAVRRAVIEPHRDLIDTIQIGNEGVFSDAALAMHSPRQTSYVDLPVARALEAFAAVFHGLQIDRLINVPLPHPATPPQLAYEWWATNVAPLSTIGDRAGYTSWVGEPCRDHNALARVILGVHHLDSGCVEDNWGHLWSTEAYRRPEVPLHHATLALALGSATTSIYTICSTDSTPEHLIPTPTGLLAEGLHPKKYDGPYCPGAPLAPNNADGPTLAGLRRLVALNTELTSLQSTQSWAPHYELDIVVTPDAYPFLWTVADAAATLLTDYAMATTLSLRAQPTSHRGPCLVVSTDDTGANTTLTATLHTKTTKRTLPIRDLTAGVIAAELGRPTSLVDTGATTVTWTSPHAPDERIMFVFNRTDATVNYPTPHLGTDDVEHESIALRGYDVAVFHLSPTSRPRRLDTTHTGIAITTS